MLLKLSDIEPFTVKGTQTCGMFIKESDILLYFVALVIVFFFFLIQGHKNHSDFFASLFLKVPVIFLICGTSSIEIV